MCGPDVCQNIIEGDTEETGRPRFVVLEATYKYVSSWALASQMDRCVVWTAEFYTIHRFLEMVGVFRPNRVRVARLGPDSVLVLWRPRSRPGGRRGIDRSWAALDVDESSSSCDEADASADMAEIGPRVDLDVASSGDRPEAGVAPPPVPTEEEAGRIAPDNAFDLSGDQALEASYLDEPGSPATSDSSSGSSASSVSLQSAHSSDYVSLAELGLSDSDAEVQELLQDIGVPEASEDAEEVEVARDDSVITVPFAGGHITYYGNTGDFVAYCGRHRPGNCRITRTSNANASGTRLAQGRCLGVLAAWLQCASKHDDAQNPLESHKRFASGRHCPRPSRAERVAARQALHAVAGANALFVHERPRAEGEDSEPERDA